LKEMILLVWCRASALDSFGIAAAKRLKSISS
jgi:hypothetical protein